MTTIGTTNSKELWQLDNSNKWQQQLLTQHRRRNVAVCHWSGRWRGALQQDVAGREARTEWDAGATVTKTMLTKMAKKKGRVVVEIQRDCWAKKYFRQQRMKTNNNNGEAKWLEYIRNCLYCFVKGGRGRGCFGWVLVTKCEMNANGKGIPLDYVPGFNYFFFKYKLLFRWKSK